MAEGQVLGEVAPCGKAGSEEGARKWDCTPEEDILGWEEGCWVDKLWEEVQTDWDKHVGGKRHEQVVHKMVCFHRRVRQSSS